MAMYNKCVKTMIFTVGFEYKGRMFGFKEKNLYRLPYENNLRFYGLKEIPFKKDHYRLCRDKVGINKIKHLIKPINIEVKLIETNETPF